MPDKPPIDVAIVVGDQTQRYAATLQAALETYQRDHPGGMQGVIRLLHVDRRGNPLVPETERTRRLRQEFQPQLGVGPRALVIHEPDCARRLLDTGRCRCHTPKVVIDERREEAP